MLTQNENFDQLLTLIVPNSIMDELVDALMSLECISGFNYCEIGGYSKIHSQFDIREQVQGYRKLQRFEVLHKASNQQYLLDTLKIICTNAKIRYWITPVSLQGHI